MTQDRTLSQWIEIHMKNTREIAGFLTMILLCVLAYYQWKSASHITAMDANARASVLQEARTTRLLVSTLARRPVVGVDNAGKIILFNPEAEHFFGYKYNEVYGRDFSVLLATHSGYNTVRWFREALSRHDDEWSQVMPPEQMESLEVRKSDGKEEEVAVAVRAATLSDEENVLGLELNGAVFVVVTSGYEYCKLPPGTRVIGQRIGQEAPSGQIIGAEQP